MLLNNAHMRLSNSQRRRGFTLIELLVVIAIIVILVSLLLAGVFYAFSMMRDTAAGSDVKQMTASLQTFKGKFGVYPPSRIRLCSNYDKYGNTQLDADSKAFINKMWPNIGTAVWSGSAGGPGIDWSGNGYKNPTTLNVYVDEILEGDQCLVFFLGGIPSPAGGGKFNDSLGFAKNNPKDPSAVSLASPGETFFAFSTDRLYVRIPNSNFPSYNDAYGQQTPTPYVFFSAFNKRNGYAPSYAVPITITGQANSVVPYFMAAGQYHMPDSFQIICAGRNGQFGAGGGPWTPQNAESYYPASNPGNDDLASFYDRMMGVNR